MRLKKDFGSLQLILQFVTSTVCMKSIPKAKRDLILQELKKGETYSKICNKTGFSNQSVSRIYLQSGFIRTQNKAGRKSKLTDQVRRLCVRSVTTVKV